MKFVWLLVLVAGFAGYTLAFSSGPFARLFHKQPDGYVGAAPENYEAHPNSFWFGTQDLLCVMGFEIEDFLGLLPDTIRSRISKRSVGSRRLTLNPNHRLVFYHDHVYEWGTGINGYHFGREAVTRDCPVTWEKVPAGYSSCPAHASRDFLNNYRENYGSYNIITNNCHHFANRLSGLLSSEDCSPPRNRWAQLARDTWREVSRGRFRFGNLFSRIKGTPEGASQLPVIEK